MARGLVQQHLVHEVPTERPERPAQVEKRPLGRMFHHRRQAGGKGQRGPSVAMGQVELFVRRTHKHTLALLATGLVVRRRGRLVRLTADMVVMLGRRALLPTVRMMPAAAEQHVQDQSRKRQVTHEHPQCHLAENLAAIHKGPRWVPGASASILSRPACRDETESARTPWRAPPTPGSRRGTRYCSTSCRALA